jgi:hypothetical protein
MVIENTKAMAGLLDYQGTGLAQICTTVAEITFPFMQFCNLRQANHMSVLPKRKFGLRHGGASSKHRHVGIQVLKFEK